MRMLDVYLVVTDLCWDTFQEKLLAWSSENQHWCLNIFKSYSFHSSPNRFSDVLLCLVLFCDFVCVCVCSYFIDFQSKSDLRNKNNLLNQLAKSTTSPCLPLRWGSRLISRPVSALWESLSTTEKQDPIVADRAAVSRPQVMTFFEICSSHAISWSALPG